MSVFPVDGPAEVRIDIQMGRVDVVATARRDVSVHIAPSNPHRSGDRAAAESARIDRVGSAIVVTGPTRWNLFGPGDSIDLTVEVPEASAATVGVKYGSAGFVGTMGQLRVAVDYGDTTIAEAARLEVRGGHGEVRASRVLGDADIAFKSGTAQLGRVDGALRVKGSDGSLAVDAVAGPLDVATSSGGVDIGTVEADVSLRSAYGTVRIRDLVRGTVRIKAAYGAVHLGVRRGTAVWLDASSEHGVVRSELTADAGPGEGDDTLELHARTGYGDITIHRATPTTTGTAPDAGATP